MAYDQAQSARLGQPTPIESTFVQIFSGVEIPEAAWPGQLIFRDDQQILQIFNGDQWEDISPGGTLTFVQPGVPTSQNIGDTWIDTDDGNRLYVSQSVGADQIADGEWVVISSAPPILTDTTHVYQKATPPGAGDVPVPKDNDFWYETPGMKQYYYNSAAPGSHWVMVYSVAKAEAAVYSSVVEYSVSSSETVAPTVGWNTSTPMRTPGTFTWVRTTVTRNDGTSSQTAPALLTGNTGATGDPGSAGPQGVPGPKGDSGTPVYTWVKYADTPTTGMSDSPTNKSYLGLSYNQASASESTNYADYQWSLIVGPDGADSSDGVPGPPGANGQPTYTWIKYATSSSGAGLQDSPTGMTYMGIAYNKTHHQSSPPPPPTTSGA